MRVVAVNSNDVTNHPEDSFEEMEKRAAARSFTFDYLYDEPQAIPRALGAERTPEVFVFDRDRLFVYHGAIDDSREEEGVNQQYLRDALDAVLVGPGAGRRRDAAGRLHRQVEVTSSTFPRASRP